MHSLSDYVAGCVRSSFKEYVLKNQEVYGKCVTPWTSSLFQIVNYTADDARSCGTNEAVAQTWQSQQFFIQRLTMGSHSVCQGMNIEWH